MSAAATRRDFLASGGALLVGFPLAGCRTPPVGQAGKAAAGVGQRPLREPVAGPPPPTQIDTWLAIHSDNTATLFIGFAELGQGATTALLQVAAEELSLGMDQIRAAPLDTHLSPNQGGTYSSAAVQRGRPQVATAAAEARAALLARASAQLGAPVESLQVERGRVAVAGRRRGITYGELIGDQRFELAFTGEVTLKPVESYRLVGTREPRVDLAAKLDGTHVYIQQVRLPGMLHARVIRPRGQAAYGAGARVISVDDTALGDIPGARLLRRGDFLGVVASREWDAVRAAQAVRVEWEAPPTLPGNDGLHAQMRRTAVPERVVLERGDVRLAVSDTGGRSSAFRGDCPIQSHAPFAPNCALADIRAGEGLVICSSQDIWNARRTIAQLTGLAPEQLRVQYVEGSGTYGRSCYDDAAQAAALLSQMAGAPVRLQLMRADEHGWDSYGPPHVGEVRVWAGVDGKLLGYEYHGWQHSWSQVETSAQLAGAQPATEWPFNPVQGVNPLVCGGMYAIPNVRLVNHQLPGLDHFRAAWLRSPLDLSFAFVSEQAIDDLAFRLGRDPFGFRRDNIRDARWQGVLEAAARAADWGAPRTPGRLTQHRLRRGRGIGLGTHLISYGAAVADVEVDVDSGRVRILHLYAALDAGLVVNPLIVERQIEGQMVQTTSRMLLEEVRFDTQRVTSLDWQGYPVLRMSDCPGITPIIVQQMTERSTGAGEETMAAAAAAIANAFFDATGKRMTRFPFTPERVLDALKTP